MSYRGRGRAGPSRRPFKPNFAAATKPSSTTIYPAVSDASKEQVTGRGKRRAEGGRGGRPRLEHNFVHSEGVLSVEHSQIASSVGKNKAFNRFEMKNEVKEEANSSLRAALNENEHEWSEDEAVDEAALAQLFQDGFIGDLNAGDTRPLVLPAEEKCAFSTKTDTIPISTEPVLPEKDKKIEISTTESSEQQIEDRVGDVLRAMHEQSKASEDATEFILLQLPAALGDLVKEQLDVVKGDVDEDGDETIDVDDCSVTDKNEKAEEGTLKRGHCLDKVSHGRRLGRLELLRSGEARVVVGDAFLPLRLAAPFPCHTDIVTIETATSDQSPSGRMCVLGSVKNRLITSFDVETLVQQYGNE